MYAELEVAMKDVGFSSDDQLNMWAAMAGILHMGNVEFGGGADSSSVASSPALVSKVAELLGLDPKALEDGFLVSKSITRGETIVKHHSKERAYDVRDALNKQIYGRLFGWIVQRINYLLGSEDESSSREVETSIGILDIFGFENFNVNGFEQLCINVTNEQLQNFFNQHIFQNELEEYRREGVDATKISFVDNGPLLDMFFSKMGMFKILDEESHFPRATDKSLVIKYNANLKSKAPMYRPHKMDDMIFTVAHYAGDVDYTSMSFLERNRDTLSQALVECCQDSTNSIVKEIFLSSVSETGALVVAERTRGGQALSQRRMSLASKKSPTVGAQFTLSLKVLIDTMLACAAHFVRCIKPNTTQSANKFTDSFVNRQLSYTGMLETCRIRREGYSYRPRFDDFMERFGLLAFASQGIDASRSTCEKVMAVSQLKGWLIGRSKVFLKYWHVEALDKQLMRFENAAVTVQSWGRRYLAQLFYRRLLAQSQQELKTAASFMQGIPRQANGVLSKLAKQNDADSRRKVLPKSNVQAPPPMPELSEAELKRQQSISWFQSKELPKGAGQAADGTVLPWFHGLISRKDAETLLSKREVGCFLVRVSETRFGYTLSYRIRTRCRHYMVEQDRRGRYALVGVEKICNSLNELINWFQRNQINDEGEMLREACGQEVNEFGEEECDFEELYGTVEMPTSRGGGGGGGGPPAVMRSAKPGQSSGAAPPAINRKAKPSAHGAAPPSISRSSKPRN
jgi:myosin-3